MPELEILQKGFISKKESKDDLIKRLKVGSRARIFGSFARLENWYQTWQKLQTFLSQADQEYDTKTLDVTAAG